MSPRPRQHAVSVEDDEDEFLDPVVDEDEFLDPVTFELILDPVLGSNGCTYDRFTAYQLMTDSSVMPGCDGPFSIGMDNVEFRGRLRRAHPETEEAMRQQRQDCVKVRSAITAA